MRSQEKHSDVTLGEYVGYLSMFFIFATILYFILIILGKLPESRDYFDVLLIVLFLVLIGKGIKYWLSKS